jgi:hypothetical protein
MDRLGQFPLLTYKQNRAFDPSGAIAPALVAGPQDRPMHEGGNSWAICDFPDQRRLKGPLFPVIGLFDQGAVHVGR